jgi:hypothetical protein
MREIRAIYQSTHCLVTNPLDSMLGDSLAARSGLSGGDLDEHVQQAAREIVLAVIALLGLFGVKVSES